MNQNSFVRGNKNSSPIDITTQKVFNKIKKYIFLCFLTKRYNISILSYKNDKHIYNHSYYNCINIHRQLVIAPVKSSKRTFGRKYASFGDFTQVSVGQRFTIHHHAKDIFKRCERAFFMLRKSPFQGVIKPFSMRDMGFSAVRLRLFRNRRLIFRPHNDNFPLLPSADKASFRTDVFLF